MLVRMVLSDRYRITQGIFQCHGVAMCMTFRVYTLYKMPIKLLIRLGITGELNCELNVLFLGPDQVLT